MLRVGEKKPIYNLVDGEYPEGRLVLPSLTCLEKIITTLGRKKKAFQWLPINVPTGFVLAKWLEDLK